MIEKKNAYGPRKIGEKAFAKQQAEKTLESRQATKYGTRKGGPKPIVQDDEAPAPSIEGNPFVDGKGARVPLGTVESLLEENAELLDVAIETEVSSAEPARKGAIELFEKLENGRAEGPRESVIQLLAKFG